MAITVLPQKKAMLLEVDLGMLDGKRRYKYRRYNLKNVNATPEKIHEVAMAMAGLMKDPVAQVLQVDEDVITTE